MRLAIADYLSQAGPRADETIQILASLGETLRQLGRLEEAETILRDCQSRLKSPNGPVATQVRTNLANVLADFGRRDEAEVLYRQNYEQRLAFPGPDATSTLMAQNNLAKLLMEQG